MANTSNIQLTKADLGPKRRALDKSITLVMVFFLGWVTASGFYRVDRIPALKDNSKSWFQATSEKFSGVCDQLYGQDKAPGNHVQ